MPFCPRVKCCEEPRGTVAVSMERSMVLSTPSAGGEVALNARVVGRERIRAVSGERKGCCVAVGVLRKFSECRKDICRWNR